jgi:hypothetical protein
MCWREQPVLGEVDLVDRWGEVFFSSRSGLGFALVLQLDDLIESYLQVSDVVEIEASPFLPAGFVITTLSIVVKYEGSAAFRP